MATNKINQILEKLEKRLSNIEAEMATKKDLQGMATKGDLAGMATKKDLQGMATKGDLAGMATKKDLKRLENRIITKLNLVVDHFDDEMMETKARLDRVEKRQGLFASS